MSQYHDSVQLQIPLGVLRKLVGHAMGIFDTTVLDDVEYYFRNHPLLYDEVVADYVDQQNSGPDRQAVEQPVRGVWRPGHRDSPPVAAQ